MKNRILIRTNLVVCLIIVVGFCITAILSYQANYSASLQNIEQVSTLTSEGIYHQISSIFTKPINVSLTMANDSFLREFLSNEEEHLSDEGFTRAIMEYLNGYQKKYNYDSVFLVSTATARYYNFNGVDRVLVEGEAENEWYYNMLEDSADYGLNVDNDEVANANNRITIFVNCKIKDKDGGVLGIVGVGVQIDCLQALLAGYEDQFGVKAYLIDENGAIELSTDFTGYQHINFFAETGLEEDESQILGWQEAGEARAFWTTSTAQPESQDFLVTRYIPELTWHLVIERDTGLMMEQMQKQLYQTVAVIVLIIVIILFIITHVIRSFNQEITRLTEERDKTFRSATEQLYDNIYEVNITKNRAAGKSTERYFESLGARGNTSYNQALVQIAEKQIKEEFREGYLEIFSRENVLREFERGNTHLRYDFMMSQEGSDYFWMRVDTYIYYFNEDKSVRMFIYRKNIDAQKRQERQSETDEMTQLLHKTATRRHIEAALSAAGPDDLFGFYIFDIDNFKSANDQHGHSFGDEAILRFAQILKECFADSEVLGRIGGDEFAAFVRCPDEGFIEKKAREVSKALDILFTSGCESWKMSASIGVAVAPKDGTDFDTLYKSADAALYQTKKNGKNGYAICKTAGVQDALSTK